MVNEILRAAIRDIESHQEHDGWSGAASQIAWVKRAMLGLMHGLEAGDISDLPSAPHFMAGRQGLRMRPDMPSTTNAPESERAGPIDNHASMIRWRAIEAIVSDLIATAQYGGLGIDDAETVYRTIMSGMLTASTNDLADVADRIKSRTAKMEQRIAALVVAETDAA